jgi:hypothetical protein
VWWQHSFEQSIELEKSISAPGILTLGKTAPEPVPCVAKTAVESPWCVGHGLRVGWESLCFSLCWMAGYLSLLSVIYNCWTEHRVQKKKLEHQEIEYTGWEGKAIQKRQGTLDISEPYMKVARSWTPAVWKKTLYALLDSCPQITILSRC